MNSELALDERALFSGQQELYKRCWKILEEADELLDRSTFFHLQSLPYLFATEHPWLVLSRLMLQKKSVLSIAGSGDVPFFFCAAGADPVIAVDVAQKACYLNELKRAAFRALSWEKFLAFYLPDRSSSFGVLKENPIPTFSIRAEYQETYQFLRESLSASARDYWDDLFFGNTDRTSPFEPLQRALNLISVAEIPYLANRATYELWRVSLQSYPIVNLPLEMMLRQTTLRFDVIYASNILEYKRMHYMLKDDEEAYREFLDRFFEDLVKSLSPAGILVFYAFQAVQKILSGAGRKDFVPLLDRGFRLESHPVEFSPKGLPGSRFRHSVLFFKKSIS